jgi:hypothetical protein
MVKWLNQGITTLNMNYLKDRNRGMIFLFLRKILLSNDKKYVPYLRQWEKIDYRKVRAAIQQIIHMLEQSHTMESEKFVQSKKSLADSLILPTSRDDSPPFLACQTCGEPFILDETNPAYYTENGFRLPEKCEDCLHH